ncbi:hypothetical protein MtrunA17_Chr6g0483641 [Medicago truncatula]|uniref:Uncharacterized protein n=1 Tax=Medicago truncatula TaxID=3880 RepID=A0A396HHC5_MEDTR|nr:hypothetical protein MtrunA17_Chr6g0483641 [Medicago truncatula]
MFCSFCSSFSCSSSLANLQRIESLPVQTLVVMYRLCNRDF